MYQYIFLIALVRRNVVLTDGFHSWVIVGDASPAAELIVRVDGRRSGVEQHLRLVDRGRHGLDGGPDAGVVGEGLLVGAGDLAHLQHVEDPLFFVGSIFSRIENKNEGLLVCGKKYKKQ